jgi:hypothetical protein
MRVGSKDGIVSTLVEASKGVSKHESALLLTCLRNSPCNALAKVHANDVAVGQLSPASQAWV